MLAPCVRGKFFHLDRLHEPNSDVKIGAKDMQGTVPVLKLL